MARFCGKIGFTRTVEQKVPVNGVPVGNGVWEEQTVERTYYGDVTRNTRRWEQVSDRINDDLRVNNTISVVSDGYLNENLYAMKYVILSGVKWKITNVEIQRPRVILTLGGVYNGGL